MSHLHPAGTATMDHGGRRRASLALQTLQVQQLYISMFGRFVSIPDGSMRLGQLVLTKPYKLVLRSMSKT